MAQALGNTVSLLFQWLISFLPTSFFTSGFVDTWLTMIPSSYLGAINYYIDMAYVEITLQLWLTALTAYYVWRLASQFAQYTKNSTWWGTIATWVGDAFTAMTWNGAE